MLEGGADGVPVPELGGVLGPEGTEPRPAAALVLEPPATPVALGVGIALPLPGVITPGVAGGTALPPAIAVGPRIVLGGASLPPHAASTTHSVQAGSMIDGSDRRMFSSAVNVCRCATLLVCLNCLSIHTNLREHR